MKYVFGQQHEKYFQQFDRPYFTHEQTLCGIGPFYSLDQILLCLQNRPGLANRIQKARAGTFIQICNRLSRGSPPYGIKVIDNDSVTELIHNLNEIKELNRELNATGIPERIRRIRKNVEEKENELFGKKPKGFI